MSLSLREIGRSFGLFLVRIALAGIFLYSGYRSLGMLDAISATLSGAGYPAPKLMAILSALATLAGGASVLLGAVTPLGCLALLAFLVPATYSFHWPKARQWDYVEMVALLKNIAIAGGLLALLFTGPGGFSVDRIRKGKKA